MFYIHALLHADRTHFTHLDGAIIAFEQEQRDKLFWDSEKQKGETYQKLFRLDGKISVEHGYKIIQLFMPVEELSGEAFRQTSD